MNRLLFFVTLALSFCAISCSKESANKETYDKPSESVYYVKYASEGLGGSGHEFNVSYTDQTGKEQSFSGLAADSFERVIGPVSVGFIANFRIWVKNTNDSWTRAARIEVKKDDSPFVVRIEKAGTGSAGVSLKYIIE